ncbi:MAG TPA: response regulator [bacterium]|nr:response regulator [bacterium]HPN44430.1 response regulator [bacterium]
MDNTGRIFLPVLIVENDKERQEILKNLFKEHAWVLVNTVERAKRLLQAFHFDIIALDFDIDGPGTGEDIARAIAVSDNHDATIIIHSMNGPGADKIRQILPEAVWAPVNKITKTNSVFKRLQKEIDKAPNIDWKYVYGSNEGDGER